VAANILYESLKKPSCNEFHSYLSKTILEFLDFLGFSLIFQELLRISIVFTNFLIFQALPVLGTKNLGLSNELV
jgi:hypothetical protein